MTGPSKVKGDRAEREAAQLVGFLLDLPIRRLLGAGRHDDRGDLDVPGWAIQVADWTSDVSAFRVKPVDADDQARRAGGYGIALLRLRGGDFRVAMTVTTWARIHHELTDLRGSP